MSLSGNGVEDLGVKGGRWFLKPVVLISTLREGGDGEGPFVFQVQVGPISCSFDLGER